MVAIKKVDPGTSASPKTIIDTSAYKVKLLSFRIDVVAKIHVPIRLSERRDSNPRLIPAPKADAIATRPRPVFFIVIHGIRTQTSWSRPSILPLNYITIG